MLMLVGGVAQAAQLAPAPAGPAAPAAPLLFVANAGQLDARARFAVRGGAASLFLADDAIWLVLAGDATQVNLRVSFPGARPVRPEPLGPIATRVSFFLGSDRRGWHTGVPAWGGVRYRDLYPGIDLELGGAGGQLSLRMIAHPGADPAAVRMRVEGGDRQQISGDTLSIVTALGEARLPLPALLGANGQPLGTHAYASASGDTIATPFARGDRPAAAPAGGLADLSYSTLYGASGDDEGDAIAVNSQGAAYIGGWSDSSQFPSTPGVYKSNPSGINGVIVKQAAEAGQPPAYTAIIGGDSVDYISGIAVDTSGAAYVVGYTASSNFPTTSGAYDTSGSGVDKINRDAFIAKLRPDGSDLAYSTYLGGSGDERGFEIAIDGAGAAYVTGRTTSSNFPTSPSALDTSYNGNFDVYVTKLSADGRQLVYSTYLGGSENDQGNDIAVDAAGSAYITGYTLSPIFLPASGYDPGFNGLEDIFVVKLSSSGTSLVYGTYVGGTNTDRGESIVVDGSGAAYVAGYSLSTDFPATPGAFGQQSGGLDDAIVLKLGASGQTLEFARYLGGKDEDFGTGVAVASNGDVFVVGNTSSADFPTSAGSLAPQPKGLQDGFVARLDASGATLSYGTYLGGAALDSIDGIALDRNGAPFVTGFTTSSNYPTTSGAYDSSYASGHDAVLSKLALGSAPRYTISGHVYDKSGQSGIGGVMVSAGSQSTATQSDGSYSIGGLLAGQYTITPSKAGYIFNPPSIANLQISGDQASLNFNADVPTYTISGQVILNGSGAPLAGVTIDDGVGDSATTDDAGSYTISGVVADSYTLTPNRSGYTFQPAQQAIAVSGNAQAQPFAATPVVQRTETKAYAPFASYTPQPQERGCDAYEPNDDRKANPAPIAIGTQISAKICSKEKLTPPNNLREDNYIVQNPAGNTIVVTLGLPSTLRGHLYVAIYNNDNLNQPACFNTDARSASNQITCSFVQAGSNVIRLYTPKGDGTFDDVHEYTLLVQLKN